MPRTIPVSIASQIATNITTLAICMKVVRNDGVTTYHTDHDTDIVYDGNTYLADASFTRSNLKQTSNIQTDDFEIVGILSATDKTQVDIRAGIYDSCRVYLFYVNYENPTDGIIKLAHGFLGNVRIQDGTYTAEVRSLHQKLNRAMVRRYSPMCGVDLGGQKCGVDLTSHVFSVTVTDITRNRETINITEVSGVVSTLYTEKYYNGGKAIWTTGDNSGLTTEIREHRAANTDHAYISAGYAVNSGTANRSATTMTVDLPANIEAGDLIIIFLAQDFPSTTSPTYPQSWSTLFNQANTRNGWAFLSCAYKYADGSEGSSITVTVANSPTVARAYRVGNAIGTPEYTLVYSSTSTTSAPNPANLTMSQDKRWMVFAICAINTDSITFLSYPSSYVGTGQTAATDGAGVRLGYARNPVQAASENPGAFSLSGARDHVTATVAVRAANDAGIDFFVPTPYAVSTGDQFSIVVGCDKQVNTCINKFNNLANFRGFPEVPGRRLLADEFQNQRSPTEIK